MESCSFPASSGDMATWSSSPTIATSSPCTRTTSATSCRRATKCRRASRSRGWVTPATPQGPICISKSASGRRRATRSGSCADGFACPRTDTLLDTFRAFGFGRSRGRRSQPPHGTVEAHVDAVHPGEKVAIVDDLLATGGTAWGAAQLVQKQQGEVGAFLFVVELTLLKGRERIAGAGPVESLIVF